MKAVAVQAPTVAMYAAAFQAERVRAYPVVDAFEQRMGYAIDRQKLEAAARVLACPIKAHPPNWQHGRVIYAAVRRYISALQYGDIRLLDIGTAKGFSALCMMWALKDHGRQPRINLFADVYSVDVIDPEARARRNSVSDPDGFLTLREILQPWIEASDVQFVRSTGQSWLESHPERVHVAFVDGKHSYEAVSAEAALLSERQQSGDLAIFDDAQIPAVAKALSELGNYELEYLTVLPNRRYAIGRRQ